MIPCLLALLPASQFGEFFPDEAAATSYGFDPIMLAQQQQQYYAQQQQQQQQQQYPPQSWR